MLTNLRKKSNLSNLLRTQENENNKKSTWHIVANITVPKALSIECSNIETTANLFVLSIMMMKL